MQGNARDVKSIFSKAKGTYTRDAIGESNKVKGFEEEKTWSVREVSLEFYNSGGGVGHTGFPYQLGIRPIVSHMT